MPYIVGGQEASISQFPWQVYVEANFEENGNHIVGACGGSILDSTHILTAAHCVDVEGTTTQHPAERLHRRGGRLDDLRHRRPRGR